MKAGTEFERLARDIFDLISRDEPHVNIEGPKVFLDGTDGKREFDLVVRTKAAGLIFLTVVECRDHGKKLDVTHVDGFHSKMKDVNANKGVLISRMGFTGTAQRKAQRLGISLYVGYDSKRVSQYISEDRLGVSLVIYEINEVEIGDLRLRVYLEDGKRYPRDMANRINDKSFEEHLRSAFFNGLLKPERTQEFQTWDPLKLGEEMYVRDAEGNKISVSELTVPFKILKLKRYWGYFHELPGTRGLVSMPDTLHEFTFQSRDLFDGSYREHFRVVDSEDELPRSNLVAVRAEFGVNLSDPEIQEPE